MRADPKIQFQPSLSVTGALEIFTPDPNEACNETEAALGYLALEMPEDAVASLEQGPANHNSAGAEALRLFSQEQAGLSTSELADQVTCALEKFPNSAKLRKLAVLYFCIDERYQAAIDLAERYAKDGHGHFAPQNPNEDYENAGDSYQNLACCAAQLGNYRQALDYALCSIIEHYSPGDIIVDPQLTPLWQHYQSIATPLTKAELETLTSMELNLALEAAEASQTSRSICDYTYNHIIPKKFKPYLKRTFSSHRQMIPGAPIPLATEFSQWLDQKRRANIRLVKRAVEVAKRQESEPKDLLH